MKTYMVYFKGCQQGKYIASSASQAMSKWASDYGTSVDQAFQNFGSYPVVKIA